jgi:hypothetical protein
MSLRECVRSGDLEFVRIVKDSPSHRANSHGYQTGDVTRLLRFFFAQLIVWSMLFSQIEGTRSRRVTE